MDADELAAWRERARRVYDTGEAAPYFSVCCVACVGKPFSCEECRTAAYENMAIHGFDPATRIQRPRSAISGARA